MLSILYRRLNRRPSPTFFFSLLLSVHVVFIVSFFVSSTLFFLHSVMITNHIIKLNSLRGSILFADPTSAILTLFSFYSKFAFTYTDAIFYSLFPSLSRSKE